MPSNVFVVVIGLTLYIVFSSFISTYIFSKAKKTLLLGVYTVVESALLLWPIVALLQAVAPDFEKVAMYNDLNHFFAALFMTSLCSFVIIIFYKNIIRREIFTITIMIMLMLLVMAMTWYYFTQQTILMSTGILLLMLSGVNYSIFFYRVRLFPEIKISLDGFVKNVKDRVAVFDENGILVDMNLSALHKELIPGENSSIEYFIKLLNSYSINEILDYQRIISLKGNGLYDQEIWIELHSNVRYYVFNASTIKNKKGEKVGTVCTLRDISEYRLISLEMDKKNWELQSLNKELETYIRIADSLEEEKERTRIALEINSTIGQKLTEILSVMEVINLTGKEVAGIYEKPLNEAIESCREVMSEIRTVVSKLIPDKNRGGK